MPNSLIKFIKSSQTKRVVIHIIIILNNCDYLHISFLIDVVIEIIMTAIAVIIITDIDSIIFLFFCDINYNTIININVDVSTKFIITIDIYKGVVH